MRLKAHHIAGLSVVEKSAYRSLIGPVIQPKPYDEYLALSSEYIDGDEKVLPYPERSPRGIMLTSFSQNLNSCKSGVAVLKAREGWARYFLKKKLQTLADCRVYSVTTDEFNAAMLSSDTKTAEPLSSPFDYWRKNLSPQLPGLQGRLLCALDPLPSVITASEEYTVQGLLVRPADSPSETAYFKEAAQTGLNRALPISSWLWVYGDRPSDS